MSPAATIRVDAREEIRRRAIVDRNDDHAAEQAAPERDDPFGTVFAPEDNFVAFREPEAGETRRERARGARHLRVGVTSRSKSVVVHEKFAACAG